MDILPEEEPAKTQKKGFPRNYDLKENPGVVSIERLRSLQQALSGLLPHQM